MPAWRCRVRFDTLRRHRMSALLERGHRRVRRAGVSSADVVGATGQTLQAGVFAITNNLAVPQTVSSVTIAFSHPALFSSATLKPLSPNFARFDINGPTTAPPTA